MKKTLAALTALGMLATATPAFAAVNSSSISIGNSNVGSISSNTNAQAVTGNNVAQGSQGGSGAAGGNSGTSNNNTSGNGDASTGNGGNGGSGGGAAAGGLVDTGDASADAGAVNMLNSNETRVRVDGGLNSSSLTASQRNNGNISDTTAAGANTGGSVAAGSTGGNGSTGGTSGSATKGGSGNGDARTGLGGSGGAGGTGGIGGTVYSGNSTSNAGAFNVLNTNFTRVRI